MECAICLGGIETLCKRIQCHQTFHDACLETWFETNRSCPLCRSTPPTTQPSSFGLDESDMRPAQVRMGQVYGFRVTPERYDMGSCVTLGHKLLFQKPYGVVVTCQRCPRIQAFNYMG